MIDWVLYVSLIVLGVAFILAEHQPLWVQSFFGIPALAAALAIFTRKLNPYLFSPTADLPRWKQFAISFCVVVALIAVVGGGATYFDAYHNPDRPLNETEQLIGKGLVYSAIGIPIAIAFLMRRLVRRK